eukprot:TRINITY_DN1250_c0_g2_i2.p1 TRINITY_DN1250_c0_g2~~TRINITY_DN1250_c0_g2_i2.p1  ORF type:complete len:838 (-),score=162.47 TRINITY_DN1250_c0_g2_i2:112-2625(-)
MPIRVLLVVALLSLLWPTNAYTDDPLMAPYWERVLADSNCTHEKDCGFPGITPEQCRDRGCCFDPNGPSSWCSGEAKKCSTPANCSNHGSCQDGACVCDPSHTGHTCGDTLITKVHLIQSCHLDLGFTDSSAGVINRYLTHHIPTAIASANAMRNNSNGWRVRFMAQSYYLSFYLDCPPHMGFTCPTEEQKAALKRAISQGDIYWHAFPHNAELENTSPVMLQEGLSATQALDAAFGLPSKRSLSQRDVPGVPRSVIPILAKSGIDLISVGVNGASMYPLVPKIFEWRDPVSNTSALTMWHPRGYGGYSTGEAVTIPGFNQALVTDWIGDNQGPGSAEYYTGVFEKIQQEFPNATIVASTFDEWLDEVNLSGLRSTLPVVDQEVGDSWIYGVPSDPKKISVSRAIDRALTKYLANGGVRDAPYLNFSRLAIKNCEHTWGKDVKSNLKDNGLDVWANEGFEAARTVGKDRAEYGTLEESWWEQRRWGKDIPLQALPAEHALKQMAIDEIQEIDQALPDNTGFTQLKDPSLPVQCGTSSIAFDTSTGAISHLLDSASEPPMQWASANRTLLNLGYRTYSQQDFLTFQKQYSNLSSPPDWFEKDFGKPNETLSNHSTWRSQLDTASMLASENQTTFLLTSVIVNEHGSTQMPHEQYGAPELFVTKLVLQHQATTGPRLAITIWCVNKTSTRLPETMFVSFTPLNTASAHGTAEWQMQKLGQWQKCENDVVSGGSKHLHGVSIGSGMRYIQAGANGTVHTLELEAVDTPVINLGEPLGFPVPCEVEKEPWNVEPDLEQFGVSSIFWNNLWGTNYVQWFPYNTGYSPVAGEENFISRYNLNF